MKRLVLTLLFLAFGAGTLTAYAQGAPWIVPVKPGSLSLMALANGAALEGFQTLTLDAPPGSFRLWQTESTNGSPLIVSGQTITNGNPITFAVVEGDNKLWLEALAPGVAKITYAFTGTGTAKNYNTSHTLTAYAVTFIYADTDRNWNVDNQADVPGKESWSLERGALIPPCASDIEPTAPYAKRASPILIDISWLTNGMPVELVLEDPALAYLLNVFDPAGNKVHWTNGSIPLQPGTITNFYVSATMPRLCESPFDRPDAFNLSLRFPIYGGNPVLWDSVRLKVAPLILPPECNPAVSIYSTRPIPGIANLIVPPGLSPAIDYWTQDMVKFTQTQLCSQGSTDIALNLNHAGRQNLFDPIATNTPMMWTQWQVGGHGGNMMVTPPLPDEPYGKIMLGTKNPASKEYWKRQGLQSVIDIDNDWLLVGHVDELFMWVSPTKLLYADPLKAAELLAGEMAAGNGANILWWGWGVDDKTNTIDRLVVEYSDYLRRSKITRTLAPVAAGAGYANIVCEDAVFFNYDYLQIGQEIVFVEWGGGLGGSCWVSRGHFGTPRQAHPSNSVVYALSPIIRKNLVGASSVASQISVALEQLKTGLGSYTNNVTFVPVPVLFNDRVPGYTGNRTNEFAAYTANLANSLCVHSSLVYYPDPGLEAFRAYFRNHVALATVPVDVWDDYHCFGGEIHCATATVRQLAPPPWWEQVSATNVWRNEK